jgi:hypothetical protein
MRTMQWRAELTTPRESNQRVTLKLSFFKYYIIALNFLSVDVKNNHIYSLKINRWIYWRNIGLCSSCRSSYRLLNYIGWKPEELSPVLYINLSVAKNFPFYVQDIWKVRSCKTCISTLLTINLQTKTCKINLNLVYLKISND